MCPHGFGCLNGVCLLNGAGGGLQYTLRFGQSVDLDLHLVEPRVAGGVCEVFWADRGGPSSTCGARSSLDLDSNADCNIDNINIENIILPRGKPVPGTYIARVDLFRSCRCAPAPSAGSTADSSCPLSRTPEGRCPASP
jgi:hypothetical protein